MRIFESQNSAVATIMGDQVITGDVVVMRYEGLKGTGYAGNVVPNACALLTDGRFSGGTSRL